ncbi:hypothetical protein [Halobacillus litoralis]|uniref:Uncharacterized protein n=1 Tax=Halobacillus litoralis TaxID=45668 RepID=A0A410MJM0_9BACI|nr:hypothetical protein [Halobacillus litoralis]QAS54855.1 hypothetical protein HLI_21630 [Halobacillus litoralis]
MQQTSIFDYTGLSQDPVDIMINQLKVNQSIKLSDYSIILNEFGLYELSSSDHHIPFQTPKECYDYIQIMTNP